MLDFNITIDSSHFNSDNLLKGFVNMTNKIETKRFWAIWSIFFILSIGISGALVMWAYSLATK